MGAWRVASTGGHEPPSRACRGRDVPRGVRCANGGAQRWGIEEGGRGGGILADIRGRALNGSGGGDSQTAAKGQGRRCNWDARDLRCLAGCAMGLLLLAREGKATGSATAATVPTPSHDFAPATFVDAAPGVHDCSHSGNVQEWRAGQPGVVVGLSGSDLNAASSRRRGVSGRLYQGSHYGQRCEARCAAHCSVIIGGRGGLGGSQGRLHPCRR
jgi:hypothetical protein